MDYVYKHKLKRLYNSATVIKMLTNHQFTVTKETKQHTYLKRDFVTAVSGTKTLYVRVSNSNLVNDLYFNHSLDFISNAITHLREALKNLPK